MSARPETDLYAPVKEFLEQAGFAVRGEVGACDLVALLAGQPTVVELKRALTLDLLIQACERQRLTDQVYVAVEAPAGRFSRARWAGAVRLCRRLGLGLLTVRFGGRDLPQVEVHCDPGPYRPRRLTGERRRLLSEFARRSGDHNPGGASRRRPLVTAYREDALALADALAHAGGPLSTAELRRATGLERSTLILYRNVYGWFARAGRGRYELTEAGRAGLELYADVVAARRRSGPEA